jgi:hypothetical protein
LPDADNGSKQSGRPEKNVSQLVEVAGRVSGIFVSAPSKEESEAGEGDHEHHLAQDPPLAAVVVVALLHELFGVHGAVDEVNAITVFGGVGAEERWNF